MHRLPRQVLQLRRIACVARPQRPLIAQRIPSFLLRRHYSSQNDPTSPTARFDAILDSCGPDLTLNELAKKYAALVLLSESNELLRERMNETIEPLVAATGAKKQMLSRKVTHYLSEWEGKDEEFVLEASSGHEDRYAHLPYDPNLEHPIDTTMNFLCSDEAKAIIDTLQPEHQQDIYSLWNHISRNPNDMKGFAEMQDLLEEHGMSITYQRRIRPNGETTIEDYLPAWVEEAREVIRDFEKDVTEGDPELAAEMAKDDQEMNVPLLKEEASVESTATNESEPSGEPEEPPFEYPNLMESDPLLDSRDVLELPPDGQLQKFHNRVIIRNHTSIFHEAMAAQGFDFEDDSYVPTKTDETEESASSAENLPLSPQQLRQFYRFPLIRRRVTQQTGKGKIHRVYVLMVVGDGNGMVGLGQGKDEDAPRAEHKAFAQAVRNMDWVERFEKRTIWSDMETKLGSTQIILRPRPVGFGLRCNPMLHQVLKAAGIKDISAKVWGSRNPINVIKAAFRLLQAGHAPLGMGDGFGGPGRKLNKGSGLRNKEEIERERGRQLINLRN